MQVIESFILSKTGHREDCEDLILAGNDFALLLDGATSKEADSINGQTGGQWAVKVLANAMSQADLHQSPLQVLEYLNAALRRQLPHPSYKQQPSATVVYYNHLRREIVRYGDSHFLLNKVLHKGDKKIDRLLSKKRAGYLAQELSSGKTVEALQKEDTGRKYIFQDLLRQQDYANCFCEYGYPVLNGTPILKDYIEVISVEPGSEIILASDGYPEPMETLAQSEAALSRILQEDPLCMQLYVSTKGVMYGQQSFDDRSYMRLLV